MSHEMTRFDRLRAMKTMDKISREAKKLPPGMTMLGALFEVLTACNKELNGQLDEYMAEQGLIPPEAKDGTENVQ